MLQESIPRYGAKGKNDVLGGCPPDPAHPLSLWLPVTLQQPCCEAIDR
jgi:hypothetical protein